MLFDIKPKSKEKIMAKKKVELKSEVKSEAKSSEKDVVHAVPMAGERDAPRKHSKVVDRFRGKVKPSTKDVKPDARPVIDIDDETKAKFVEFAATKELFDIFEESKKEQTSDIYGAIFDKYKDTLWRSKTQPKNPAIKVNNTDGSLEAEGQFIVQVGTKIKINMPAIPEGALPEDVILDALVDLGVKKSNAARIIEDEVSFVSQWSLNFTDMLHGVMVEGKLQSATDPQISASELLFQVINGQDEDGNDLNSKSRLDMLKKISEEGWVLIKHNVESHTKYFPQLVDGANFLDRVCNYAESREELDAILTVFCPVHFCQRVKFACSDTEADKKNRLLSEAKAAIMGEPNDDEVERAYSRS
jgi:hypothetical protein